jgi:hypothetical protein
MEPAVDFAFHVPAGARRRGGARKARRPEAPLPATRPMGVAAPSSAAGSPERAVIAA